MCRFHVGTCLQILKITYHIILLLYFSELKVNTFKNYVLNSKTVYSNNIFIPELTHTWLNSYFYHKENNCIQLHGYDIVKNIWVHTPYVTFFSKLDISIKVYTWYLYQSINFRIWLIRILNINWWIKHKAMCISCSVYIRNTTHSHKQQMNTNYFIYL